MLDYYEFNGHLKLVTPFFVNLPYHKGLLRDAYGQPMIGSPTLRGWLRHATYRCVLEVLHGAGQQLSLDQHYLLAKGVVTKGQPVLRQTPVGDLASFRQQNPVLDLFGQWGLPSSLAVGNAYGQKDDIRVNAQGVRQHIHDQDEDIVNYLSLDDQTRLVAMLQEDENSAPKIRELKTTHRQLAHERRASRHFETKQTLQDQMNQVQGQIDDIKRGKQGSTETVRNLHGGEECLAEGAVLQHQMRLYRHNPDSLALLIWVMSRLSLFPLGGLRAFNYGVVQPLWEVNAYNFNYPQGRPIGQVGWIDGVFTNTLAIDGLDERIAAMHEYLLKQHESLLNS